MLHDFLKLKAVKYTIWLIYLIRLTPLLLYSISSFCLHYKIKNEKSLYLKLICIKKNNFVFVFKKFFLLMFSWKIRAQKKYGLIELNIKQGQ